MQYGESLYIYIYIGTGFISCHIFLLFLPNHIRIRTRTELEMRLISEPRLVLPGNNRVKVLDSTQHTLPYSLI